MDYADNIHTTFMEPKLTMREGLIRTLERKLDPNRFVSTDDQAHE